MFQSFEDESSPEAGPARLAALRDEMRAENLAGFLVPRADAFQGEYVAPGDARLAWLTGFTGSAGFCAALLERAGIFVDGRYRVQVRAQVDTAAFEPVDWPEVKLADWLKQALPEGGRIGFDPWLHTAREIEAHERALEGSGIALTPCANLVDRIWADRPPRPLGAVMAYPLEHAGESSAAKRGRLARALREAGQRAAVLTLPDSISWLLNIRGADIPRNPVVQAFAILHDDGRLDLFSDRGKFAAVSLDDDVTLHPYDAFEAALAGLRGPVRVDRESAPLKVSRLLEEAGIARQWGRDPCLLPKARKNAAEIAGTREAHLRDGAAMAEFLCWLEGALKPGALDEITLVRRLEEARRATGALRDISFDTICGAGPNGALPHYRVSHGSNRRIEAGDLIVLDSGGQYLDGTTDITRTLVCGPPAPEARAAFTRVLKGMIAISRLRWPAGLAGQHLDALARYPLWLAGQDYDHGTGHGVGVYLCVHEGPQRLSRLSDVPLEEGMILSNEPGYYREGAFGIRTENLLVVQKAPPLEGADGREMLAFETLTWVPIERRLIAPDMLSEDERAWLNAYHAETRARIAPRLSPEAAAWLERATAPI